MSASGYPTSGFSGVRRRIPRYPVAVPVDVTVLRSGSASSIPGRSLDIGEGGVAAVLAAELQTGEWVAVEFQLPNVGHSLQTKAVVRHHNQLRCGFEFLGLSRDQRVMIRQWAGVTEPELATIESAAASSVFAKTHSQTAMAQTALRAPGLEVRRSNLARRVPNPALRRLQVVTLAMLLVVASMSAWQWHRGWRQLEARVERTDVHAHPPAARVPPEVMERLLIHKVEPVYPEAARKANLQGVVALDAVIASDGTVVNLHPVSGPDGLISAAMDAARWWRFRPYRVRGEPAAVETTLSVEFRL
ncbi:MAG: TonB family protein [Terriglobales bacterium]